MNKDKLIQVVGITGTVMGLGATIMQNWTSEKKLDIKIDNKVNEILEKKIAEILSQKGM